MDANRQEQNFVRDDVRRTLLKVHLLWRLGKSSANPYSLVKEFGGDQLIYSFFRSKRELRDDVYNAIRSLEKAKLVTSVPKEENGRLKQYYSVTKEGEKVLNSSIVEFIKGSAAISSLFRRKR